MLKKYVLLVVTQSAGFVLSFALTVLLARGLRVEDYGTFRYGMSFLGLVVTIFSLGWPTSAARLLALEVVPFEQRRLIGASICLVAGVSVVCTVLVLGVRWWASALELDFPAIIVWLAPFSCLTIGAYMLAGICQGLNAISILSVQQVLGNLLLIPLTALQIYILKEYSLISAVFGYAFSGLFVLIVCFLRLRPSFVGLRTSLKKIAAENKVTGFPLYIGGLFSVASAQLTVMAVAEFTDSKTYGQYALAGALAAPLAAVLSSIGTVIFRGSSTGNILSKRFFIALGALVVTLLSSFCITVEMFLTTIFGQEFGPSILMSQILAIGTLANGVGDIFQRYLTAKGYGHRLSRLAIGCGLSSLLLAVLIVPRHAAAGAIVVSVVSGILYFCSMGWLFLRQRGAAL